MAAAIDNVDFSILNCVKVADQTLWKKEIHTRITGDQHALPVDITISPQTVGRRIDALEDDGYLESTIATSEEVNRNLLIGFRATEEGKSILDEKRETLLKKIVSREMFGEDAFPIEKEALEQLIHEEFTAGLATDATNGYSRQQLLVLLGMHFIETEAFNVFSDEERQQLHTVIQDNSTRQ